jgi:RNA polymerase sigma-70 factor (ECF subfamily)
VELLNNVNAPVEVNDKVLVERMLRGEEPAFDEFFDSYFPPMYRFAIGRVDGNVAAAEDVVQTAMAKAVRKLNTFRGEAMLLTWLLTFCRHEIGAYWRVTRREPSAVFAEDAAEVEAALDSLAAVEQGRDPESIAARGENSRLVQMVLDRLPRHYGDVLEWKYIDGRSVREIASRLGVGEKAAESLLARARGAFRDAFSSVATATAGGAR